MILQQPSGLYFEVQMGTSVDITPLPPTTQSVPYAPSLENKFLGTGPAPKPIAPHPPPKKTEAWNV